METTKLTIPEAHGNAINGRRVQIQHNKNLIEVALPMVNNTLMAEDSRHVDAVLRTLGQDPETFQSYELVREGDNWALILKPKSKETKEVTPIFTEKAS